MLNRQLIRFVRRAALALGVGMALISVGTAPAAAAPGAGSVAKGNALATSDRASLGGGSAAASPVRQQLNLSGNGAGTGARRAVGPTATTCTVNVGPPVLIGSNQVKVDYGVTCDNLVERFFGAIGIARNGTELLGGTIDIIDARGAGFSFAITRTCAPGLLYGDFLIQVTFRNGEPRQITGEFLGPAVEVGC